MKKTSESEDVLKFSWWDMIKAIYFLLDKKRKAYTVFTVILVLVLFYDMIPTLLIGKIVDFFTNYRAGDSLNLFYYYVAFFTITWGLVSMIRLSVKKRLSSIQSDTAYFTKVKGFDRLLDYSIKWHDKENTGNKVQRIQAGADSLRQVQTLLSDEIFVQLTNVLGVLVAFLFIMPIFTLYCLLYMGIFFSIQASFYRRMLEMNNANNILLEKAGGTYFEGLNNILTIKTLGVKDDFKKNVVSRESLARDHSKRRIILMNNKWKSFQIINALFIGGVLYFTGMSYVAGAISLGSIFVIYNYHQRLSGSIMKSTTIIDSLMTAKVSIARMMSIIWGSGTTDSGHLSFPKDWNEIEMKNLTFRYERNSIENEKSDGAKVETGKDTGIQSVNLRINKYEKIGVVGKSGSGKSTFAKMMLKLYDYNEGTFRIGDSEFRDIKHDEITKEIALVLQDSEMFNLSLKENITLMREFNAELFQKSITIAQLGDVIEKLPNGFDTLIGEKGYRLSGGERQRIGIARAIYKDPQILVLDEATSSLDSKTEGLIQQAFEDNLKKKTVISIAHRVSTLKNVDKIIVFDNGKIVEEGRYDDLSQDLSSRFHEIYKTQHEGIVGEEKVG